MVFGVYRAPVWGKVKEFSPTLYSYLLMTFFVLIFLLAYIKIDKYTHIHTNDTKTLQETMEIQEKIQFNRKCTFKHLAIPHFVKIHQ